jgi:hypothetical protein
MVAGRVKPANNFTACRWQHGSFPRSQRSLDILVWRYSAFEKA